MAILIYSLLCQRAVYSYILLLVELSELLIMSMSVCFKQERKPIIIFIH